jgi:hypothetical protein
MAYGIEDYRKPEVLIGAPMAANTSEKNLEEYSRGGFGQNTARYNEMNPQQLTAKSSDGGSLISPELQGIIDKVTSSSSSMSPRQRSDIAHLAGVVGGLQQNRMTEQGQMARLGVTEGSQANRFAATNALAQGQLGVHQGQLGVQQEDLALKKKAAPAALQSMISGGVGASDSKPKPWHSDYPDLMNYFK